MPIFKRSEKEIITEHLQFLNTNTNIKQMAPGSKARFFISTISREESRQYDLFDSNMLQAYIKYAEGQLLDFFGDMLKVKRIPVSHAEDTTDNFYFYVSSGVFGDINSGSGFTIPKGTLVQTTRFTGTTVTPGISEQPTIQYITTDSVFCDPNESFAYTPVRALVEGKDSAVSRNVLNQHNFISYSQNSQNLLKCTNRYSIDNGTNRESDGAYKYRLSKVFKARNMAIGASIRFAALSVPGVLDIKTVNSEQGPGTYSVFIKTATPTVSAKLLSEVNRSLSNVSSYGIKFFVSAPRVRGLEFLAAINWSSRATAEQISNGYNTIRERIENKLNSLDIGQGIDFDDLIDIVRSSSPLIAKVGRNKENKFEEIYSYRLAPNGEGIIRSTVTTDSLDILYNERITLETSTRFRGIQFITF